MNKKIVIPTLLLLAIALVSAGEFWLQPLKFIYKPGEKFSISFKTGENFMGEPWEIKKSQIENMTLHEMSKSFAVTDSVMEGNKDNVSLTLKDAGTCLLTM